MIKLKSRIDASQGRIPSDLILKNATYLDVFQCRMLKGDVALFDGVVVGVESGLKAKREIDLKGKFLVPGFIDAHVHLESSLMNPYDFETCVLKKGTTTAICDPHELANVRGERGIEYFLKASEKMDFDLKVMMSSCVPATHFETNGGGEIKASGLHRLAQHANALGLAEMMNVPGVLNAQTDVLEKIEAFTGRPLDGHCPLVRGQDLSTYATAGISSCHESSQLEEASEKLSKGIAVWIREGSVAKDLDALIPLLNMATSPMIGFCTDDRNPYDIAREGHIDYLVRKAIQRGVDPLLVYRTASFSVARHYGLHIGKKRVGAIAPGYQADLVVLSDLNECKIEDVFKSGKPMSEFHSRTYDLEDQDLRSTINANIPEVQDLKAQEGRVNVIGVQQGKIITDHLVMNHDEPGVARLTVLERYGKGHPPANGYVYGFGKNFKGAIASSVGHDSHNLIVVGTDPAEMQKALACLIQSQGGFCVVQNQSVLAQLALPIGGLMSLETPAELTKKITVLKAASKQIGCELNEPFLQLAFLSLPVIPALKLTDLGLFDVNAFKPISVRVA